MNFFFFYGLNFDGMIDGVSRLVRERREDVFIATGTESRDPDEMRNCFDAVRQALSVDVVDLFFCRVCFACG